MADSETYTKVSNDVLEALAQAKLNGTQYAICLVVWRYTFGFHKCEAELSASFIAEASGTNPRQIKRELQVLINRNIIQSVNPRPRVTSTLRFNKDISTWKVSKTTPGDLVSNPSLVTNPTPEVVTNPTPDLVSNPSPKKRKKENNKENIYSLSAQSVFAKWNEQGIITHRDLTSEMDKVINAAVKKYGLENVVLAIERYAKCYKDPNYFFKYKWSLIYFLKQKNALPDFLDGGCKWEDYKTRSRDGPGRNNNQEEGDVIDWGWQKEKI